MKKVTKKILDTLSRENLESIILELSEDKSMAPAIEKAIIAFDPNALAKSLKTQVSGLKRGKKFLYPSETPLISEKIDAINSGIQKLLEQNAAESAVDLCQKLIATDEAIFARADDSYGYISCSFYKTYSLLDEAFCAANTP